MPIPADILTGRGQGIVAFVGAGGKTTLMFRMAESLGERHGRILVTTTTRIMPPEEKFHPFLVLTDSRKGLLERADAVFSASPVMVAASRQSTRSGKLIGFDPGFLDEILRSGQFEWILAEADGANRKPIKAPAAHEPVIPLQTRYLFGLIGLSALGKPVSEPYVHRVGHFRRLTGLSEGATIDLDSMASLVRHPLGLFKGAPAGAKTILFMNQADIVDQVDIAGRLLRNFRQHAAPPPETLIFGQARKSPWALKVHTLF